jgi:tripartite-type tricarboxylate transporter receptor subunit TctC
MSRTTVNRRLRGLGMAAAAVMLIGACGDGGTEDSAAPAGDPTGAASDECENYPDRDLTMIIGRSPGGGHDEYGRFLAPILEKELGQTVIVKNVEGAGGRVAAIQVQKAEPDGLTFHLMEPNGLAAYQSVNEVEYDLNDFTMLGTVNARPSTFAVAVDSKFETFEDLVAAGKKAPLRFATSGLTSPNFANGVIAAEASGIKVTPVPHEGSNEAITSVVRGDSDFTVFSGDSIAEKVKAGDLRALVQFGDEPVEGLEDVPLADAVGLDELGGVLTTNLILVAPPELPDCEKEKLTAAVQNALNSDEFKEFGEQGRIVSPGTAEETAELIQDATKTYEQYSEVLKPFLAK